MKYYLLFFFISINVYTQLVEDFIISENALTPDITLDNEGFIHLIFDKTEVSSSLPLSVVSIIKLDDLGRVINPVIPISDSILLNTPVVEARNNILASAWRNVRITFNSFIDGNIRDIQYNNIDIALRYNSEYYDSERFHPDISWLSDSTFIVVWQGDAPPLENGIYGKMTKIDGSFLRFDILLTDHIENTSQHSSPKVVSPSNSNDFSVFWSDDYQDRVNIWGRCFDENGEPKGNSYNVSDYPLFERSLLGAVK